MRPRNRCGRAGIECEGRPGLGLATGKVRSLFLGAEQTRGVGMRRNGQPVDEIGAAVPLGIFEATFW